MEIPNRAMAAAVESTVDGFGGAWGFGGGTMVVVDPALLIGLVVDAALLGDAAIVVVVVIDPVVVTPNAVGPFPCCKPANGSSGS